jgi:hypothetical protein
VAAGVVSVFIDREPFPLAIATSERSGSSTTATWTTRSV